MIGCRDHPQRIDRLVVCFFLLTTVLSVVAPPNYQSLGTACCLRDVAWHPYQHVLALAGYGQDAPVLLYCGEARADKQDKASLPKVATCLNTPTTSTNTAP